MAFEDNTAEGVHRMLRAAFAEAPEDIRLSRYAASPGRRPVRLEGAGRVRFAAVLLVVVPDPWSAILMERTPHPGVHGGQISIPGGEVEPTDASRLDTALREFREEMGVAVPRHSVVGQLTSLFIPPSGFEVEAFVAVLDAVPDWAPDPREVAAVLRWRLHPAPRLELRAVGPSGRVPAFECEGRLVWGATAILLTEFLAVMRWGMGTA